MNKTTALESIFAGDTVRFRYDCIIDGFYKYPEYKTANSAWSIKFFNNLLQNFHKKNTFRALEDQLVIVDNLQGFHARTYFDDKNRHLIRARIR